MSSPISFVSIISAATTSTISAVSAISISTVSCPFSIREGCGPRVRVTLCVHCVGREP